MGALRPSVPQLERNGVTLRLLTPKDEAEWLALRQRNRDWLRPWEATTPPGQIEPPITFRAFVRRERASWRERRSFPFVIEYGGELVGRASLGRIEWGAERGGTLGYWVSHHVAGRGIAPTAVVLLTEYAFGQGLHRVEIAIRPENDASLAVVRKLNVREEGLRHSYLYIDGGWRDHRIFAITTDEHRSGEWWTGVPDTVRD